MIWHEKRHRIGLGLAIALLVIIVNITWWPSGNLISGLDWSYTGFSGQEDLRRNISTWNEDQFWGVGNFFNTALIVWDAVFALAEKMGFSAHLLERLLFSLLIILAGTGLWHLLQTIHKKTSSLMISAALFYVTNFFTVIMWHNQLIFLLIAYAVLPWFLALYIQLLENERSSLWKFLLLTLVLTPVAVNPPTIIGVIVLPLAAYSVFFLIKNIRKPKERKRWLVRNTVILTATLLLHAWWLLPAVYGSQQFEAQPPITEITSSLTRNTEHLTLENLLNFGGHWSLYENNLAGQPYFHFASRYISSSSPWAYLGYIFVLLATLAVLRRENFRQMNFWIWPAMALVFLFLAKGPNEPLGYLFTWLTQHLPIFWIFRSPEYKFLPVFVLCVAVLISFHFRRTAQQEKKMDSRMDTVVAGIIIITTLIHAYPFFNGALFEKRHADVVDARQKYADWIEWSRKQSADTSLYILPQQDGPYLAYTWGYEGIDFSSQIIHLPSGGVRGGIIYAKDLAGTINEEIFRQENPGIIARYLAETGTDYIVQRNDVDTSVYPAHLLQSSARNLAQFLPTIPGVEKEQSLGDWDVYSFAGAAAPVRAASQAVFWTGPVSTFADLLSREAGQDRTQQVYISLPAGKNPTIPYQEYRQKIAATDGSAIRKNTGWIMKPQENPEGIAVTGLDSYVENKLEYQFTVPENNSYTIEVLLHYGASQATLAYEIDQQYQGTIWPRDPATQNPFDFRYAPLVENQELSAGEHTLTFVNQAPFDGRGIQEIRHIVVTTAPQAGASSVPKISATRKSPTHWQVTVQGAERPFYLIFGQTYHPGWVLSGTTGVGTDKDKHFIAQGYANGWYMEQTGDYTFSIRFWPQQLLLIGAVISLATLVALLIFGRRLSRNH